MYQKVAEMMAMYTISLSSGILCNANELSCSNSYETLSEKRTSRGKITVGRLEEKEEILVEKEYAVPHSCENEELLISRAIIF